MIRFSPELTRRKGPVEVEADLIVMAVGSKAKDASDLEAKCQELGIPCTKVGDARKTPGMAIDAIRDACNVILEITGS